MAPASVGDGVAEALADRASRFVGGQFQPLYLQCELAAAVQSGQRPASKRQLATQSPPVGDVLEERGQPVGLAEREAVLPEPALGGLHRIGDRAPRAHRVQAKVVQEHIPLDDAVQVRVLEVRAQEHQRLQLGPLHAPTLHLHDAPALDRAARAPGGSNQPSRRKRLAVDRGSAVEAPALEVPRGDDAELLHRPQEARRPQPGERAARDRMRLDRCGPPLDVRPVALRLRDGHRPRAPCRDALEVLRAEDGAHARAPGGALVGEQARVRHKVLAGRARHQRPAALAHRHAKCVLRRRRPKPPHAVGVVHLHAGLAHLQPRRSLCARPVSTSAS